MVRSIQYPARTRAACNWMSRAQIPLLPERSVSWVRLLEVQINPITCGKMPLDNAIFVHIGTPISASACSELRQATTSNKVTPASIDALNYNVIFREAVSLGSADAYHEQGVAEPSSSLSPGLRSTLGSMGVTHGALESWASFHVCPVRAMLYFFIPISIVIASLLYLQFAGVPLHRLYFTIPCLCTFGILCGYTGAFWRYGPAIAKSPAFLLTLPFLWTGLATALTIR
jgi:hypothetical protein